MHAHFARVGRACRWLQAHTAPISRLNFCTGVKVGKILHSDFFSPSHLAHVNVVVWRNGFSLCVCVYVNLCKFNAQVHCARSYCWDRTRARDSPARYSVLNVRKFTSLTTTTTSVICIICPVRAILMKAKGNIFVCARVRLVAPPVRQSQLCTEMTRSIVLSALLSVCQF